MKRVRTTTIQAKERRGAIAILAAIFLGIVVVFLAFSVDFGHIVVAESDLQNAADAGAMSGARALPGGQAAVLAAVKTWAAKNTAATQPVTVRDEDIELGDWNDDTATFALIPAGSPKTPNAVRVACRRIAARGNSLNLFFGAATGTASADLTVTATAKLKRDICGLFVGLQSVDVQNADVDSYDATAGVYDANWAGADGNVCSDGPITLSPQGEVNGDALPGDGFSVNRPGRVTGSTASRDEPIEWSPVETLGPSLANNNDVIPGWALSNGGRRLVVEGSNNLVLDPGTYYLPEGLRTAGNGQITITGPTKLILGGDVTVEGNGLVNQTLLPANLRIEMVSPSARLAGSAALHADIYAPTTQLTVATSQHGAFYGAIFAGTIVAEGSVAELHGDESLLDSYDDYTSRVFLRQ